MKKAVFVCFVTFFSLLFLIGCPNLTNISTTTTTVPPATTTTVPPATTTTTIAPPAYRVTYDGNGNTGGSVPVDSTNYFVNDTVTVLGKSTLTRSGYVFGGWNTRADGTGTDLVEASTFTMGSENVILYARWRDYYIVGDIGPASGLVFYDKGSYSDGWRYLEAADRNQSSGIVWDNGSRVATGATATGIGSGSANTAAIVSAQGAGSYAASLCANLVLGGYDDWFLPSKDELDQMYHNLKAAGYHGFLSWWYWSSSEYNSSFAWIQNFSNGAQHDGYKLYDTYDVRAVRAF